MEFQEGASTSMEHPDNVVTTLSSWFDYLSFDEFLGARAYGCVFKATSGAQTLSAVKITFVDEIGGESDEEKDNERRRISREYYLMEEKEHENLVKILKSTNTKLTVEDFEQIKNLSCLKENESALDIIEFQSTRAKRRPIASFCIQMELCGKTLGSG